MQPTGNVVGFAKSLTTNPWISTPLVPASTRNPPIAVLFPVITQVRRGSQIKRCDGLGMM